MTALDRSEFAGGMLVLGETFSEPVSDVRIAAYFEALSDLPLAVALAAMHDAIRTCRFFPRPVELRELADGGSADVRIEGAWIAWRDAALHIGGYRSLVVTDAALGKALLAVFGSWPAACRAEFSSEMWASKRKEFDRAYRLMAAPRSTKPVYLHGECETSNQLRNEWVPVAVGLLDGQAVRELSAGEVDAYRQQAALPEPDAPLDREEARAFLVEIQKRLKDSVH